MTIENQEDGLTDEERAAIAEGDDDTGSNADGAQGDGSGDDTDADAAAAAAAAGNDGAGDGDDKGEPPKKPDAGTDGAGTGDDGAGAGGRDDGQDPDQSPAGAKVSQPLLVAEVPKDADEKLKAIEEQKKALRSKYEDGDLTMEEYEGKKDVLEDEKRGIERAKDMAQIAEKMESQRRLNLWGEQCDNFLQSNAEYQNNKRLIRTLDAEVRELGASPEFKDRTDDRAGPEILAKAHKNLIEAGIIQPKVKAEPKKGDGDDKKPEKPKPKEDLKLPPNLKDIPAAEKTDTGGSKFAALDRLADTDPIAYEDALVNLSDAQRAEYLKS